VLGNIESPKPGEKMSKRYFTKYIPNGGDMKPGSKVLVDKVNRNYSLGVHTVQEWRDMNHPLKCVEDSSQYILLQPDLVPSNTTEFCNKKYVKEVSLHLCTQDLKPGDQVTQDGVVFKTWTERHEEHKSTFITFFKVIGEISPEAVWVKEGDELDEKELQVEAVHRSFPDKNILFYGNRPIKWFNDHFVDMPDEKKKYSLVIKIFNYSCKHFH
jgi:hypothetical protein